MVLQVIAWCDGRNSGFNDSIASGSVMDFRGVIVNTAVVKR